MAGQRSTRPTMRLLTSFTALAATALFFPSVFAIRVAPGSPCSSKCGNVLDSTLSEDIVCDIHDYTGSVGTVFKNCLECELGSPFESQSPRQSDMQWMLYNLRYSTSYCLFGFPDNPNAGASPCITTTACGPLKDAILFGQLATNVSTYDYCASWQNEFVAKCASCLHASEPYLSNFISVLDAACQQQPLPGHTVGIEGIVFSRDIVNATDAAPLPTLPPDYFKEGPFTLAAKVGVAFGALALVLVVAGFAVICNGRRKRRAFLRKLETSPNLHTQFSPSQMQKVWAGHVNGDRDHGETPMSQRPLHGWDDSPLSAVGAEKPFPRYVSPYASQFSSPVSATDAISSMAWPEKAQMPTPVQHEIGLALGGSASTEDLYGRATSPAKGKAPEQYPYGLGHGYEYEYGARVEDDDDAARLGMSGFRGAAPMPAESIQPPVLHHPGNGRPASLRRQGLTEEDARRGDAL